MPPILRTQDLTYEIEGKRLVDHINLEVQRGEFLAIVGPSGAGKSSFLRLLNRLAEPTAGMVYIDGQDYRQLAPQALRQQVGMVLQAPYLFPGTVADNLRFGPAQHNKQIADAAIERLLVEVDLPGYAGREVSQLSGGEAQRVSLARTLANKPEILLLDEPTSALDETSEHDVEQLILGIVHSESLTTLMVTHDMAQAQRLADHAMMMQAGKMVRHGPTGEVLHA
ncbi:MAG: phosphate ABC transporter ATP-binding protein [Anaerolineae bacterium]|nr:phosphate ABC transporter ATP-binding protein [Anaerolineae bacterium]